MSDAMEAARAATFLHSLETTCNVMHPRDLGDGRYCGIIGFAFTHAIITGRMGDTFGYEDRWCYHGYGLAKEAFDAWDGSGEPEGWHRHPATGRRRENGDPETEYLNP